MKRKHRGTSFAVCVRNEGYETSLELRKIYRTAPDTSAARHQLLKVIDESGEDYLYPKGFFLPIDLPPVIRRAMNHDQANSRSHPG
jgi:hypothetical protein